MAVGIKESLELMDGVIVLAVDGKHVVENGSNLLKDLPLLLDLLGKLSVLAAAVKGVENIPLEMQDLSPDEINQLAAKVLQLVAAIKAA